MALIAHKPQHNGSPTDKIRFTLTPKKFISKFEVLRKYKSWQKKVRTQNVAVTKTKLLTYFQPIFHFYTPWKHQKASGFRMFSGGIEVEHWLKMG